MKIAVVTGTRAEYGLLAPLMHKIQDSQILELQLIVTGAHLLPEFGSTVDEITRDGFNIDRLVPELSKASTGPEVARQVGRGIPAFVQVLEDLSPEAVLLLGDRYELLAAAIASFFLGIPIVHLHGGELTQGAFDDAIRHTISQYAHIHAVAAPEYRNRLIRAGASPESVHIVGGLGIDSLQNSDLLSLSELEEDLGIALRSPVLLVTYHPVTSATHDTAQEIDGLIQALRSFPEATVVFTLPNADPEHKVISDALSDAVISEDNWHLFSSLGSQKYLSLMSHGSAVIGNSSSGLMEAPSLGVPTVNIGPRQSGRLLARSVFTCGPTAAEIRDTIGLALAAGSEGLLRSGESPYGQPGASERVLALLEATVFASLGPREYYDLPHSN